MSDERRQEKRFLTCFAGSVDHSGERPRSALIQNISVSGASLLTRAHVEPGDSICLDLFFSRDEAPKKIDGTVVRVRPVKSPLWSRMVAIAFDQPAVQYEREIAAHAAEQAAKGIVPSSD